MKPKEYRTADKSEWARGPWDDEPDKMQFTDAATGLPCLIVRSPLGALCGYVGVPADHPYFGREFQKIDLIVHGGITFGGECQATGNEAIGVCHAPDDGETDSIYWIGFDCAHAWDVMPGMEATLSKYRLPSLPYREASYKTIHFVKQEIKRMARQLAAIR